MHPRLRFRFGFTITTPGVICRNSKCLQLHSKGHIMRALCLPSATFLHLLQPPWACTRLVETGKRAHKAVEWMLRCKGDKQVIKGQ